MLQSLDILIVVGPANLESCQQKEEEKMKMKINNKLEMKKIKNMSRHVQLGRGPATKSKMHRYQGQILDGKKGHML